MPIHFRLDGRKALVTGAAQGIGRAVAEAYMEFGAAVAACDVKRDALWELADEAKGKGWICVPFEMDVTDRQRVREVIENAEERLGGIDTLASVAGIHTRYEIHEMPDEAWDRMIAVNLTSCFNLTKVLLPRMGDRGFGVIVQVSSVAGVVGSVTGASHYGAAKGGLIPYIRSLAREWGPKGIRANCIGPGLIDTQMTEEIGEVALRAYLGNLPLGRIGTPDDIAGAAVYLASDAASYVTGQILKVCGGYLMA